ATSSGAPSWSAPSTGSSTFELGARRSSRRAAVLGGRLLEVDGDGQVPNAVGVRLRQAPRVHVDLHARVEQARRRQRRVALGTEFDELLLRRLCLELDVRRLRLPDGRL